MATASHDEIATTIIISFKRLLKCTCLSTLKKTINLKIKQVSRS